MADRKPATMVQDGHAPLQKGWIPTVQGGYKPSTSALTSTPPAPPTGGSGVKPVKDK